MKNILIVLCLSISVMSLGQSSSRERDSVAQTEPFRVKVKMATHKAANNILADPGQFTRIRQYAQVIISDPNGLWVSAHAYGCMTNPAINHDSSDGDIEFTVNSLFSKFAYAYFRESQP